MSSWSNQKTTHSTFSHQPSYHLLMSTKVNPTRPSEVNERCSRCEKQCALHLHTVAYNSTVGPWPNSARTLAIKTSVLVDAVLMDHWWCAGGTLI
jgi:hypothetical protein